jgi:hypothetical protein
MFAGDPLPEAEGGLFVFFVAWNTQQNNVEPVMRRHTVREVAAVRVGHNVMTGELLICSTNDADILTVLEVVFIARCTRPFRLKSELNRILALCNCKASRQIPIQSVAITPEHQRTIRAIDATILVQPPPDRRALASFHHLTRRCT